MAFIYEIKRNKKFEDLTGKVFGRLTVLQLDEDRNIKELNRKLNGEIKQNQTYYICQCSCGNIKSIPKPNLKNGHTISCGCYMKEQQSKVAMKYFKKYNKYDLTNNYGICYLTDTGLKTYFDLEDYNLIKDILWKTDECGYARGYDVKTKRLVRMHKIITDTDENTVIDHINRDKLDNRKENFRYATKSENRINSKTRIDNVSGIQGVRFEEGKWRVRISVNGRYVHLGMFDDFEEAVKTRLKAEKKYYGEFAMQINLFEKYGIA